MKALIYTFSGTLFAIGLSLSSMIDPLKVKNFLDVGHPHWNPSLLFVLAPAVLVYFMFFRFLRYKKKTINGSSFSQPKRRPIDKKLIYGSILFGVGWGMVGVCPGPALVHIAFLDKNFFVFILAMFLGFELQKRLPWSK